MKKSINTVFAIFSILFAFSCQEKSNKSSDVQNTKEVKPVVNEEFIGVYSFLKAENKDTTIVRLNFLSDDDIRGEMIWQPWQKDGATGDLKGKLNAKREMEWSITT